jgi:hypothetical protein
MTTPRPAALLFLRSLIVAAVWFGLADLVEAATPTVTTPTATSVTATGATLGGNVTSDGGASITERGVVYSATAANNDPLIGGTGVTKVTATGTTGVFTAMVSGLTQGTGYSFKVYAINSQGTSYSNTAIFTQTLPKIIHVSAAGNDTTGNGSSLLPFQTIQKGVDAALNSDVVQIIAGTYTGSGNFNVDLKGKRITISGQGSASTIIDCARNRAFIAQGNENTDTIIQDVTIRNGYVQSNEDWNGDGIVLIRVLRRFEWVRT